MDYYSALSYSGLLLMDYGIIWEYIVIWYIVRHILWIINGIIILLDLCDISGSLWLMWFGM
jgi:hypothetical protein